MDCDKIESEYVLSKFKIRKKRHNKKKLFLILFTVLFCVVLMFMYFNNIVNPLILSYGEAQVRELLLVSSNNAIRDINDVSYQDLITINYDSDNKSVTSIYCNSFSINKLSNNIALTNQQILNDNALIGINIPIGTLSGISFFIGKGSDINFIVEPKGRVKCDFFTTFTSAGINQTSHKIFVRVQSEASLILPFTSKVITHSVDYLVSEFLIVGEVPSVYFNTTNLSDLYK